MATTTATITLSSSDIGDSAISISNTATLTTAGTDTGLTETTGLARKKTNSGSNTVLLDSGAGVAADVTADKAAKVYIKNINDRGDGTKFVNILLTAVEIGRLYGGDWMFFPWSGGSGKDIEFTASDTTETTLEYVVFYE
tara:strand:+ start:180 stop:599 length:420 start_codon:yes stop_codon:yes gene_type:complete